MPLARAEGGLAQLQGQTSAELVCAASTELVCAGLSRVSVSVSAVSASVQGLVCAGLSLRLCPISSISLYWSISAAATPSTLMAHSQGFHLGPPGAPKADSQVGGKGTVQEVFPQRLPRLLPP